MPHHQTRPPAGQRPVPGRPTPSHKAPEVSGRIAKAVAAFVLRLSGYRILARRWRCNASELDIVARRGFTLAFVEVEYRHMQTQWYGLTQKQKNRIARATALFVNSRQISRRFEWRFDVIPLQTDPAAWPKWCLHIKNA